MKAIVVSQNTTETVLVSKSCKQKSRRPREQKEFLYFIGGWTFANSKRLSKHPCCKNNWNIVKCN